MDGWLINIENTLPLECLDNVILFLQLLTKQMHETCGVHSQVIWYDAVTTEGKLQWQDGLSTLNKPFFDACDAIFINYTWKECSLLQTKHLLDAASPRCCTDVFYGVDVYGRGTLGGGGYNCCEALNFICNKDSDPNQKEHHLDPNTSYQESLEDNQQEDTLNNNHDVFQENSVQGQEQEQEQGKGHYCGGESESGGGGGGYSAALFAPGWVLETQCTPVAATDPPWRK